MDVHATENHNEGPQGERSAHNWIFIQTEGDENIYNQQSVLPLKPGEQGVMRQLSPGRIHAWFPLPGIFLLLSQRALGVLLVETQDFTSAAFHLKHT